MFSLPNKVCLISIPKAGTHLAHKALQLLTDYTLKAKGPISKNFNLEQMKDYLTTNYVKGHIPCIYNNKSVLKKNNVKAILIYRDPRDVIVSKVFWHHKQNIEKLSKVEFDKILLKLIYKWNPSFHLRENDKAMSHYFNTIDSVYRKAYLPWAKENFVYTTTFEKLVGSRGGGNDYLQFKELQNIAKHIGLKPNTDKLKVISSKLFGYTFTFKKGLVGSWKKYFNKKHKNAFKKIAGQLLIDLGYEQDFNW